MLRNLGHRIRQLRKTRSITLVEMAKRTGVAQATLSRIETGTMTGTVESHEKIAEVLGIGLAELYAGVDRRYEEVSHLSGAEERNVTHHNNQYRIEILTQESSKKKITPVLLTIQAESVIPKEENERGIEKFFYVLEGEVKVTLDEKDYILKENDTLYFDASLPHEVRNDQKSRARILCAVSPSRL